MYTDPTGHFSVKKFLHSVVAGIAAGVVAAITAPLGPAISGMFAGATYGAIMGGFEGGWKGAAIGAGIGAFIGANVGIGVMKFGSGFAAAVLGASTIYTAATEGWEGLGYMAGGMLGGMVGYQAGMAVRASPAHSTTSSINNSSESQQTSNRQIEEASSQGKTQLATDIGQKTGLIEGRMRAAKEIASNALSPYTGTGAEEARMLNGWEKQANEFEIFELQMKVAAEAKKFYNNLAVDQSGEAIVEVDWYTKEVTNVYNSENFDGIYSTPGGRYKLQYVPYEAVKDLTVINFN